MRAYEYKRPGRLLLAKIIGFTLMGEAVALPVWTLLHAAVRPSETPVVSSIASSPETLDRTCDAETEFSSQRNIVPITIYDGPLPITPSDTHAGNIGR